MSSDGEGFVEAFSSVGRQSGYTEETLNLSMTAKQPPSYDGRVSWLRHEELVDDWVTFTTIDASKRGPLLKSRPTGDAHMYKAVAQNDLLQDADEGVNYFKNTLKKFFLKGSTNVPVQTSEFHHRRQNTEFLILTSKFEILLMRLKAADASAYGTVTRVYSFSPRGQCKKNCRAPASRWRTSTASRSAAARQCSDSTLQACRQGAGARFRSPQQQPHCTVFHN